MGDDDSAAQQEALAKKISIREKTSTLISSWIPNLHLQLTLNQLSGTSMRHYITYLDEAERFHERLRLFFYPKVFDEHHAVAIDWEKFLPVFHKAETPLDPLKQALPLILSILVIIAISFPLTKRI